MGETSLFHQVGSILRGNKWVENLGSVPSCGAYILSSARFNAEVTNVLTGNEFTY